MSPLLVLVLPATGIAAVAPKLPATGIAAAAPKLPATGIAAAAPKPPRFRFAATFTSHAVLQSAPARAILWGFAPTKDPVTVTDTSGTKHVATIARAPSVGNPWNDTYVWRVALPPVPASMHQHSFTATTAGARAAIDDVLFGDVWVCSGQSNMAYSINGSNGNSIVHPPVNESLREISDMANYPHIRLMRFGKQSSSVPMLEPVPADRGDEYTDPITGWSSPCPGGQCRVDFSAVCWFFGRDLFDALRDAGAARPIGLLGVYWGGTSDEEWSSQEALDRCIDVSKPDPAKSTTLWKGMLHPLLNQTIKGVTWYQGENDARHAGGRYDGYNCTFPQMIRDLRAKWHAASGGATAADFPFGYVQLNSIGNASVYNNPTDPDDPFSYQFGYAGLRWSQSAGYGYTPNPAQRQVFSAVSLDTPDRPYPYPIDGRPGADPGFNVHSPFKQPVGARLARAGLGLAYSDFVDVDTTSPLPGVVTRDGDSLLLEVTHLGQGGGILPLRSAHGFEVSAYGRWHSVPATREDSSHVRIHNVPGMATKLRYAWYSNPCGEGCFGCMVYVGVRPIGKRSGEEESLPLPPFVVRL